MVILYYYWVMIDGHSEILKVILEFSVVWRKKYSLIFKQCSSNFITNGIPPGIYSMKDNSEVDYTMGDHEGTLQIEYNDISMKTKIILTRFGLTFGTSRFNDKSFFNTLLGFTPCWDYKPTNAVHADNPGVYTSEKNLIFSTIDKSHLKCDIIDGSVVNGIREPILYFSYTARV